MTKARNPIVILLCVIYLIALVILLYPRWMEYEANLYGITHKMAWTDAELKELAMLIQNYVDSYGKRPPQDAEELVDFFNVGGINYIKSISHILKDQTKSYVLDYFGNPINLVIKDKHHYVFISSGPDGRYEEGKGDDIICEFDPWKLVDANEPNKPAR